MEFHFALALGCYCLVAVLGLTLRNDVVWYTGLSALGGMGLIACLTNIEQGRPYILWNVMAAAVVVVAAPWWKAMLGIVPRKERRMWRELFGEPSLADMLFRDPRLKGWRKKT